MPWALWWSLGGGAFLMSEVPLYRLALPHSGCPQPYTLAPEPLTPNPKPEWASKVKGEGLGRIARGQTDLFDSGTNSKIGTSRVQLVGDSVPDGH